LRSSELSNGFPEMRAYETGQQFEVISKKSR